VASDTDVLRRGVELRPEITGVRRMAEDAVALPVRQMLNGVGGQGVASKAESSGGRGKSDVGGARRRSALAERTRESFGLSRRGKLHPKGSCGNNRVYTRTRPVAKVNSG
jgi:hypothetical protein